MPDASPTPAAPGGGAAAVTPAKAQPVWTNFITLIGLLHVIAGVVLLSTFMLFTLISPAAADNQYLGVIGYMILPGVLVNGLVMCPVGIWLRRRRLKRGPIKQVSVKNALVFLAVTLLVIMPILGVSGYQGYHFTESPEFCGTVCHNMDPQYVRYNQSPHAHATCVGCHIGPGASPFVKSKLSGLRQVVKVAMNSYPRPIPAAIRELRPARDTCGDCHWPQQFFGSKLKTIAHYAPDEKNTRHTYEILIKVGGLNNYLGKAEGIHMHMLDHIEYVSGDAKLEHISWVRYTYPDGHKEVFRSDGKVGEEPPAPDHEGEAASGGEGHVKNAGEIRKLDCIDCHNLAGHEFVSPERAVNHALSVGQLDLTLPYLKREAVRAIAQPYKTTEEGTTEIGKRLGEFYQQNYPELWKTRHQAIAKSIEAAQTIYKTQCFPAMHVDWKTYPNHIGHMESAGCFRCHDGLHINATGRAISNDCTACHTFLYRQPEDPNNIRERSFDHPMKIHEAWQGLGPHQNMLCSDCHDGGLGAIGWREYSSSGCGDCHPSGRWLKMRNTFRPTTRPTTQPTVTMK